MGGGKNHLLLADQIIQVLPFCLKEKEKTEKFSNKRQQFFFSRVNPINKNLFLNSRRKYDFN